MSETERSRFHVALLGFSATERIMLSSMFQLSAKRLPSYVLNDDPFLADILVVNGDDSDAIADLGQLCAERVIPSVWVGGNKNQADTYVQRPITWTAVFEALDGLVERGRAKGAFVDPAQPRTIPLGDWIATPGSVAAIVDDEPNVARLLNDDAVPEAPWALVVARESRLRQFLGRYLSLGGFNVEEIDDVRMAVAMNAARDYICAFVQTDMDSVDGFTLCRILRVRRKDWPKIALVLPEDSTLQRLRARWVGAQIVLAEPISRDAIRETVNRLRQEALPVAPN